ncbi:MAG: glycosyltransferase 87 family protein [Planctomycetes bacterium]|nr:glycosyltransferase 87 family protein [Planctomycetota bacterium]
MNAPSPAPRAPRLLLAVAVAAAIAHAVLVGFRRNEGDLRVYHDTVGRLVAGLDLYQTLEGPDPTRPTGFIYPLPFALVYAPLTALPFPIVRVAWALLMGLLAVRCYVVALRLTFPDGALPWAGRSRLRWAALAVAVAASLRFVLSDLQHGQVNVLVLWLSLEGVAAAAGGRDRAAGAWLAAAALVKLTPGLLVAGEWAAGRRRLAAAAAGVGAALAAAPALVLGPRATLDATWRFVTEVTPWNARFHAWVGNNASLTGLLHRLLVGEADAGQAPAPMLLALDPATGRAAALAASVVALGAALALARRLDGPARPALLLAAIPLISPIAWKPHLVVVLLPALVAARLAVEARRAGPAALLALSAACLLAGREVVGRDLADAATRWGAPTVGLALLAGVIAALGPVRGAGAAGAEAGAATPPP